MEQVENVSDTAVWVANFRAEESARPDRLFDDPLAARLAAARGAALAEHMGLQDTVRMGVVMRTVLIDRMLMARVHNGVDLVLNLGAGLDTRPYRLDLPSGVRWVEADFEGLIRYKTAVLADCKPRCPFQTVAVDLTDGAARRRFLSETTASSRQALVLTEGVITYLTNHDAGQLAIELHNLPSVHYWIQNYTSPIALKYLRQARQHKFRNAPVQFAPEDWFRFFAQYGWSVHEKQSFTSIAKAVGRFPKVPFWQFFSMWKTLFFTASRSGCVVFEKKA